jgi:hypothetical protein
MRGAQWTAHGDDAEAAAEMRKPARQCAPDAVAFAGDNSWSRLSCSTVTRQRQISRRRRANTSFFPKKLCGK